MPLKTLYYIECETCGVQTFPYDTVKEVETIAHETEWHEVLPSTRFYKTGMYLPTKWYCPNCGKPPESKPHA